MVLFQPTRVFINNNWITDVIVYETALLGSNCDLSNNPLLGNPDIANLTSCTQIGLYSMSLMPSTVGLVTTSVITYSENKTLDSNLILMTASSIMGQTIFTHSQADVISSAALQFFSPRPQYSNVTYFNWQNILRIMVDCILLGTVLSRIPIKNRLQKKKSRGTLFVESGM